jgi:hypothetical protein
MTLKKNSFKSDYQLNMQVLKWKIFFSQVPIYNFLVLILNSMTILQSQPKTIASSHQGIIIYILKIELIQQNIILYLSKAIMHILSFNLYKLLIKSKH